MFNGLIDKFFAAFFAVFAACLPIAAQQLPVKQFTVNDGLAGNQVLWIYADSRGFLWLPTSDGLSRFDGYNFDNYDKRHGLPDNIITGILEDADGVYWVATFDGLARVNFDSPLDLQGKLDLTIIKFGENKLSNQIRHLFRSRAGKIWAATDNGLFKIVESGGEFRAAPVSLDYAGRTRESFHVKFVTEDADGNFWLSTHDGLLKRDKTTGNVTRFEVETDVLIEETVGRSTTDERGRLWLCSLSGLYVVMPPSGDEKLTKIKRQTGEMKLPNAPGEYTHFAKEDGIAATTADSDIGDRTFQVFKASDGRIWAASDNGVTVFDDEKFVVYSTENNLPSASISRIGEDRAGNMWLGSKGLVRIADSGFTSYGTTDGLPYNSINSVFGGKDGEIYASAGGGAEHISRFTGQDFDSFRPLYPAYVNRFGWAYHQNILQRRNGEWWFPTARGAFRFPAVGKIEDLQNVPPIEVFDMKDGLPNEEIFRLYEDRNEDVWISIIVQPANGLARWHGASGKLEIFDDEDIGLKGMLAARTFAESADGDLWIGFNAGNLARFRDEKWQLFNNSEVIGEAEITDLFFDRNGTLWIATSDGIVKCKNPSDENPVFEKPFRDFASGFTSAITDDAQGRLYFGTKRGVTRIEPKTGRTTTFTPEDGLAGTPLTASFRDKTGILWFSTTGGLSRLDPAKADENTNAPTILIRSIKAGGEKFPLGELGETEIDEIVLQPNQSSIEIEAVGLTQKSSDNLLYQYKLRPEDDWSEATKQRIYNFARLDAGDYKFQIRAINSGGIMSETTAKVSFSALVPFYLRWWFIIALLFLVSSALYLIYRYRLQKLLEIERIRLDIATDLHDDIGSSLSQISLISEVLATKQNGFHENEKRSLETISETSRSAVGSMSEMVWAINPKRDNLRDLVFKMRRFASETLNAAEINFTFISPDLEEDAKIRTGTRRQIYMIFKEAVNNAMKHSVCKNIEINFIKNGNSFLLEIADDGKGFDSKKTDELGNGIVNMRQRAVQIGGKLEIVSDPNGTKIILNAPAKSGIFSKILT